LNFGVRFHFSINDFFATSLPFETAGRAAPAAGRPPPDYRCRKGMFMSLSSSRPSSSLRALVTIVTSIPRTLATLS